MYPSNDDAGPSPLSHHTPAGHSSLEEQPGGFDFDFWATIPSMNERTQAGLASSEPAPPIRSLFGDGVPVHKHSPQPQQQQGQRDEARVDEADHAADNAPNDAATGDASEVDFDFGQPVGYPGQASPTTGQENGGNGNDGDGNPAGEMDNISLADLAPESEAGFSYQDPEQEEISTEELNTPPAEPIKWDLRESVRQGRMVKSSWYDADKSGNYDPNEDGKSPKRTPRKRRASASASRGCAREKKPKPVSPLALRQSGASFVVTVPIQSAEGREMLSRYSDNWPEDEHNVYAEKDVFQTYHEGDSSDEGHRLRRREKYVRYRDAWSSDDDLPVIEDPSGKVADLRGYPAARGCKRCRLLSRNCSLLKSNATWPCEGCIDDVANPMAIDSAKESCELIVPPTRKQICESCAKLNLSCSYVDKSADDETASDPALPCLQCKELQEHCIAGPALPRRITYTPPPGVKYIPYRRFIRCTACRREKKWCSLKSKEQQPPCRSCQQAGKPCTFESLDRTAKGSATENFLVVSSQDQDTDTRNQTARDYQSDSTVPNSRSPSPMVPSSPPAPCRDLSPDEGPMRVTDIHGNSGFVIQITTTFAHPITFACNTRPCSFHDETGVPANSRAAIVGNQPWKTPSVIEWSNGQGYTELHGGYRQEGQAATNMCRPCTDRYLQLLTCDTHEFDRLGPMPNGMDRNSIPVAAAFIQRLRNRAPEPEDRWCSICTLPGVWECVAEQEEGGLYAPERPGGPRRGCGLLLCQECYDGACAADTLQGFLSKMLATEDTLTQCRADALLLLEQGILAKSVVAMVANGEF